MSYGKPYIFSCNCWLTVDGSFYIWIRIQNSFNLQYSIINNETHKSNCWNKNGERCGMWDNSQSLKNIYPWLIGFECGYCTTCQSLHGVWVVSFLYLITRHSILSSNCSTKFAQSSEQERGEKAREKLRESWESSMKIWFRREL